MPTLAREIVLGNKNGGSPQINFKGVFVGNPYTDPYENKIGAYGTYGGHSLVPRPLYLQWVNECDNGRTNSVKCSELENTMSNAIGDLDPYALDFPVCTLTANQQKVKGIGATNHIEKLNLKLKHTQTKKKNKNKIAKHIMSCHIRLYTHKER